VEAILKRKYREAMRAAARERDQQLDDDDEAIEARDWHEDWTQGHEAQQQQPESQQ
jgi:hypothetical protein